MEVTFFDNVKNRLVPATVIKLDRTTVLVYSHEDKKRWKIRYCMVNLDDVDTDINPASHKSLDRTQLKEGDLVGFRNRQNQEVYGRVIRLNQKSATIATDDGSQWRVAYSFLFEVLETDSTIAPEYQVIEHLK